MNNQQKIVVLSLLIGLALTAISYLRVTQVTQVTVPNCITLQEDRHGFPRSYYEVGSNIGVCTVALIERSFSALNFGMDFVIWSLVSGLGLYGAFHARHQK